MNEQLDIVKALLAAQRAKHDPVNSIYGAPATTPVPGSTPTLGPSLGSIGNYLLRNSKAAYVDPIMNLPESRQAQNLSNFARGAQQLIQGGLAPRPLPPGASSVMSAAQPWKGFQEAGPLLDYLKGPAAAFTDKLKDFFGSEFFVGKEWSPEERAEREEAGRPEPFSYNLWQAEQRLKEIPEKARRLYESGKSLFGPSDPGQQDWIEEKGLPFTIDYGEQGASPAEALAPTETGRPTTTRTVTSTPGSLPDNRVFNRETDALGERPNRFQTALAGMARGAALPLPVGGGSLGLLLARAAAGAGEEQKAQEALDTEAARYADALGIKEEQLGVDWYNAQSARIAAQARQREADSALIAALAKGQKDPRKEQGRKWSAGPGASRQEEVIAEAKNKVGAGVLPENYNKMLHDFAAESLARLYGEDWATSFEFAEDRQEILEEAIANEVGTILSTQPELLIQLHPDRAKEILELQAILASYGGAKVIQNY